MATRLRSRLRALTAGIGIPAVGTVLLIAAMLKLHAMVLHGVGLADGALMSALIAAEMLLGGLLLFTPPSRLVETVTALIFACFAGYSVYLLTIGKPTCNCFGVLSTRVWHSLGIDLVCLAILTTSLALGEYQVWSREACRIGTWLSVSVFAGTAVLGALLIGADNIPEVAWLRGEAVRINPHSLDSVFARVGEARRVQIRVANKWRDAIKLVGGTFGCACNLTTDLPATLTPGESRELRLVLSPITVPGRYKIPVRLYTDVPWQSEVYGVLNVVVLEQPGRPSEATFLKESRDGNQSNDSG